MIWNLADKDFLRLMGNPKLHLPVRWDGRDFEIALEKLLDLYVEEMRAYSTHGDRGGIEIDLDLINNLCTSLRSAVRLYHQGYPGRAFDTLEIAMHYLIDNPIRIHQKRGRLLEEDECLNLFRVRNARKAIDYSRQDIFHVPVSARSMISTCRYSIAGYPSLYLSTALDLCIEETSGTGKPLMASLYRLARQEREIDIHVIELAVKPQDFIEGNNGRREIKDRIGNTNGLPLWNSQMRSNYLKWYPLIAACSFIRADKTAPFASEYIVPQLLMQWIRKNSEEDTLIGIRYFSCFSKRAAEMGYDYVFPTNNHEYDGNYCSVLRKAFLLTSPVLFNEYDSTNACEEALKTLSRDRI